MKTNLIVISFYVMLVVLFLSGCNKLPLVTFHQLDLKHNQVNPFKVTKYNEETCKLEVESLPSKSIPDSGLHGGFCLTAEDFAKLKSKAQADCRNKSK